MKNRLLPLPLLHWGTVSFALLRGVGELVSLQRCRIGAWLARD